MTLRFCVTAMVLLLAGSAAAQTTAEGSVTFGAGGYSNGFTSGRVLQFGGGGEAVVNRRVGIGGDVLLTGGGGDAWVEWTSKAEYRFIQAGAARVTPFVSGGYTLLGALTERGGFNGANVGGGILYSLGREAIRIEARDVVFNTGFRNTQYVTVRISLTFR